MGYWTAGNMNQFCCDHGFTKQWAEQSPRDQGAGSRTSYRSKWGHPRWIKLKTTKISERKQMASFKIFIPSQLKRGWTGLLQNHVETKPNVDVLAESAQNLNYRIIWEHYKLQPLWLFARLLDRSFNVSCIKHICKSVCKRLNTERIIRLSAFI